MYPMVTILSSPAALILIFLMSLVAGACGAMLLNWGYRRSALELEYRLSDLEARLNREVKIRAATESHTSPNRGKDLKEWASGQGDVSSPQALPAMDFKSWRKQKMTGK